MVHGWVEPIRGLGLSTVSKADQPARLEVEECVTGEVKTLDIEQAVPLDDLPVEVEAIDPEGILSMIGADIQRAVVVQERGQDLLVL